MPKQGKRRELFNIIDRTNKENPSDSDINALKKAFSAEPELLDDLGSLSYQTIYSAIRSIESSSAYKELLLANWKDLSVKFGEKDASPFEKLLIQNVISCWIRLNIVEVQYSQAIDKSSSLKLKKYWESRLNASQQRFLRAMETYSRIKKHAAFGIFQLNIAAPGGKQFNMVELRKESI